MAWTDSTESAFWLRSGYDADQRVMYLQTPKLKRLELGKWKIPKDRPSQVEVSLQDNDYALPLPVGHSVIVDEFSFKTTSFLDSGVDLEYDIDLPSTAVILANSLLSRVVSTTDIMIIKLVHMISNSAVSSWVPYVRVYCTASRASGGWLDIARKCTITRMSASPRSNLASRGDQEEFDDSSQVSDTPSFEFLET